MLPVNSVGRPGKNRAKSGRIRAAIRPELKAHSKDLGRRKSWKAMERYLKRDTTRLRRAIESVRTAPNPPLVNSKPRTGQSCRASLSPQTAQK